MKKTALITGASRGIGRAIAEAFAPHFDVLHLTGFHSKEALEDLKKDLESRFHTTCVLHIGDIGDYDFVSEMFQSIDSLDVLVNNAGISYVGLFTDMTKDEWDNLMHTNLDSCFYTCKHAVPLMLQKKSGKIINISSIWGCVGASMEVAYSATKGGLNSFTMALAKELAPSNIQVNAIACGVIDTDMNRCFSEEDRALIIEDIPADRFGEAKEVGTLALQLSNSPSYLTGQIIRLDGGII